MTWTNVAYLVPTTLPLLAGAVIGAVTIRKRGLAAVLFLVGWAVLFIEAGIEVISSLAGFYLTPLQLGEVLLITVGYAFVLLGIFTRHGKAPQSGWRPASPGAPGFVGAPHGYPPPPGFPPPGSSSVPPAPPRTAPDAQPPFQHDAPSGQPGGWQPPDGGRPPTA